MKDDQDKQCYIEVPMSEKQPNRPGRWLFRDALTGNVEVIHIVESCDPAILMSTTYRSTHFTRWQGKWSTLPLLCQ